MTLYAEPDTNILSQRSVHNLRDFEKARRHSKIVKVLKFVFPVFVIMLVGVFLYASGAFSPSHKLETEKYTAEVQSIQINQDSVKMVNLELVTQSNKSGAYKLHADSATRRIDNPNFFNLDKVNATMTRKSGGWAKMKADRGSYNKKTDILILTMNVKIRSNKGIVAHLKDARVDIKKGELVTDKNVTVDMPNGVIHASRMKILNRGKIYRFEKRAYMKLNLGRKGQ